MPGHYLPAPPEGWAWSAVLHGPSGETFEIAGDKPGASVPASSEWTDTTVVVATLGTHRHTAYAEPSFDQAARNVTAKAKTLAQAVAKRRDAADAEREALDAIVPPVAMTTAEEAIGSVIDAVRAGLLNAAGGDPYMPDDNDSPETTDPG